MNVTEVSISEIKPYTANPRVISEQAVSSVANSIQTFGWQQPIVVDAHNFIIAGHTRFLAAKHLGMETVPTHKATDLTPEQVRAYRVLDNKLNELSDWDEELLEKELQSLEGIYELESLLALFAEDNSINDDASFLNDMISGEPNIEGKEIIGGTGDYVTMSFVMTPVDRDMCLSALRTIQNQEGLDNTTQALLKLLKEIN